MTRNLRPLSLALAAAATLSAAHSATVLTSTVLKAGDLNSADSANNNAALLSSTLNSGTEIGGVTTSLTAALGSNSSPQTISYRVTGAGYDFTYDVIISAWASAAGVESTVNMRRNGGVQPDSGLSGQHRQRIDSPNTVGAGNWEFMRLKVENVVATVGSINLLGFSAGRMNSVSDNNNGNIERASDDAVIASWTGSNLAADVVIDLSANYTNEIDFVGTSTSGNNANRLYGFAVDFELVPEPSTTLFLGISGLTFILRRRRR